MTEGKRPYKRRVVMSAEDRVGTPIEITPEGFALQAEKAIEIVRTKEAAELEAFMNEMVVINISRDSTPGAYQVACPIVNGMPMPIQRGFDTPVKRKYVEALAHAEVTTYTQDPELLNQGINELVPMDSIAYPFQVKSDSAKGIAWFNSLKAA